jgi:hypothetical protein
MLRPPMSRLRFHTPIHRPQSFDVIHVVPERCELRLLVRHGHFSYPVQRLLQVQCPSLRPGPGLLIRIALGLGPFPPSAPPVPPALRGLLCSPTSSVLWVCPTSRARASMSCSSRIHTADPGRHHRPGRARDLPGSVRSVSVHVRGLRPRGTRIRLAIAANPMWPSAFRESVGVPDKPFSRLFCPTCTYPCQRFATALTDSHA